MYHASEQERIVHTSQEEAQLGPGWSRTYIHREYPKAKLHWSGEEKKVQNADEEAALPGGWGDPAAFAPYKVTRPERTEDQDPTKWVDGWSVLGLTTEHRREIKAVLLRADATFDRSADPDAGSLAAMRQAFDGIAQVLFDAQILTADVLRLDLPHLVWDSAIAGGWWRLASDTPQNIFPEKMGHYWIWRDGAALGLFLAETREWQAKLLDDPRNSERKGFAAGEAVRSLQPQSRRRHSRKDPAVQHIKQKVRKLRAEGVDYKSICDRLGETERPPRAAWRGFAWPVAYKKHRSAVTKWLSEACNE
jgi:hypothetical protein